MKKLAICLICGFLIGDHAFSQMREKSLCKSIYALYGHQLQTTYNVDSGQGNLVGRKNVFSAELGMNFDYKIAKKFFLRTGVNAHILFLSEITYGISGPLPPPLSNSPVVRLYIRGIEQIESVTISVPIMASTYLVDNEKFSLAVFGGPSFGVYFPASDEKAGLQNQLDNGTIIREYWVTRHFKNYKSSKSLGISYPQIESDLAIESKKPLKKYGAISLGVKLHIGTQRLEHATFDIFPELPTYRSKGHFTLNRSYLGIYCAFTFCKHK